MKMYVCGVTVYDDSHIGHARTIIFFDVLRRYLLFRGYKVLYVQNFTDIDDRIINKAHETGASAEIVANLYTERYFLDFTSLNVLPADKYPLATKHIHDIIAFIKVLLERGYAYVSTNGVYFHVRAFGNYGKLSKKTLEELEAGSRIEIDPFKRDPLDFALWKFYSDDPNWTSPWGKGRPGWHIECSVMAFKYLGDSFDIHGGGNDLIFPHHENEIAQCESYSGKGMARFWLHVGMVSINGEKMSKSIGNIISVAEATRKWGTNALRIYCISAHYSKPLDFTDNLVEVCLQKWRQVEICAFELRFAVGQGGRTDDIIRICRDSVDSFRSALEDDMNTALAFSVFMKLVNDINRFAANEELTRDMAQLAISDFDNFLNVLGLKLAEPSQEEMLQIESLLEERDRLRREHKFADSDIIRKKLSDEYSIRLIDHRTRTIWMRTEAPH